MQPRTGDECGEVLHEFQGFHDDLGGAISVRCLQREHHLPGLIECKTLVGNRRPGDVATQMFELMALMDSEPPEPTPAIGCAAPLTVTPRED